MTLVSGGPTLVLELGLERVPPSAEVLVVASDQRQASIVFNLAKRMIELNPELSERAHVYKDRILVPHNDATLTPLPADPVADGPHRPDHRPVTGLRGGCVLPRPGGAGTRTGGAPTSSG